MVGRRDASRRRPLSRAAWRCRRPDAHGRRRRGGARRRQTPYRAAPRCAGDPSGGPGRPAAAATRALSRRSDRSLSGRAEAAERRAEGSRAPRGGGGWPATHWSSFFSCSFNNSASCRPLPAGGRSSLVGARHVTAINHGRLSLSLSQTHARRSARALSHPSLRRVPPSLRLSLSLTAFAGSLATLYSPL